MARRMGKDSIPVAYASLINERSVDFCRAFAQGCKGSISNNPNMLVPGDVAAFWLPELFGILDAAKADNRNWYYGDKAYFNRLHYWRITKNAKMHNAIGDAKPDRFRQLHLTIKPWQNGSDILLCPQSDTFFRLNGSTQADWIKETTDKIRQYTDRPIRIHTKQAGNGTEAFFRSQLGNVWAVVVHSSIAGVQAVLEGIPCFVTDATSTPASFGTTDFSKLEHPVKPDNREQMAWVLADNQWTLDEIKRGMAWEHLKGGNDGLG